MEFLIRGGRGMSYHEFALWLKNPETLNVRSSLDEYVRKNPVRFLEWWLSDKRRYRNILRRAGPKIHAGFYEQMLNLAIEKNGNE